MRKVMSIVLLVFLVACSRPFFIQQSISLVKNGSFEGQFIEQGAPELKVPEHWIAWWDSRATRPEYKPATTQVDPRRIHSGNKAAQWFNNFAVHTAGLYQVVNNITIQETLRFEVWIQAFSSGKDDFTQSNGRYRMRIGIDPYGGINPESPDVVWSNEGHAVQPYDAYHLISVETPAKSDRCTVFIWGQAEWPVKHNNGFADDAVLYQINIVEPTPTPAEPTGAVDYERIEETMRRVFREEWPILP